MSPTLLNDSYKKMNFSVGEDNIQNTPIAIIGMAFRFPGNLHDEATMWSSLAGGQQCITQVPDSRWPVSELQHANRSEPGRSVTFSAGILSDIDKFDAAFFGISPREAAWLDPQQRLLLEMAYESMEHSGVTPKSLAGTRCGVYVGISSLDYGLYGLEDLASMSAYSMTGNTLSVAANRLSYFFDLRGPSVAMDTACSSSLVALHYACAALRNGEVPMALVGGVSVLMHPYSFVGFSKASMLSANGHCRPFDAAADGYVRAEGGAVLLLKPLQKALEDGDHIHAAILASGVNADGGRKSGLTIPSAKAQTELMRDVLSMSSLHIEDVDFIEAHGTGTPVGDPVEALAIGQVYGQGRVRPMPISSVKANLGHLESASGMAGLVKAVLSLKRGMLPPMALDYTPNPNIDFTELNVKCAASGMSLHGGERQTFTAGVNSFGFGGVNAHVLLQTVNVPLKSQECASVMPMPPLLLSARSEAGLRDLAAAYVPCVEGINGEAYYNLAYSAAFHRDRMEKRLAVAETNPHDVAETLRAFAEGKTPSHALYESAVPEGKGLVFVYTGNGAQWSGMGHALLAESPRFSQIIAELDAEMQPLAGFSVAEILRGNVAAALHDTTVSQPLLFAIQVGVTMLLREQGLRPDAVMGHSVGEIAAAWAAGALSLQQAMQVIHARSHAQGLTRGAGRMAVVGLSATAAQDVIQDMGMGSGVEIAGINSPHNVTLSGSLSCFLRLQEHAQSQNIFFRLLDLDYAFHSHHMESIRDILAQNLKGLTPSQATSAIFTSTVTGSMLEGSTLDSEYWWRNVRQPVLFSTAVQELASRGFRIFVEVGPHAILQRYIRESMASVGAKGRVFSSLLHGDDGVGRITRLAARLHLLMEKDDLSALFPHKGQRVSLPLYPWQKEHCWHPRTTEGLPERRRVHPLLGWPLDGVTLAWENILHPTVQPWLADHKVGGVTVFPGAGYAEMALAAARFALSNSGKEHVTLESLDIAIPLVFEDGHAQSVRCSLNREDGSFQILSRPRLGTGEWVRHVTGRVMSAAGRLPVSRMEALPENGPAMSSTELYAHATALGLEYGPVFRVVTSLRKVGERLDVALTPVDSAVQGYMLHPAALDACFHSLVSFCADHAEARQMAFLPVKTGRLDRYGSGVITHIRARVRRCGPRSMNAHFEMLDAAGCLVAEAEDCRFRAVPLIRDGQEKVPTWSILPWLSPHSNENFPSAMPPMEELIERLHASSAAHTQERETWFRHTLPLMEAMTLSFVLRVFRTMMAEDAHWLQNVSSPYAQWLAQLLREEGLLHAQDGQWILSDESDIPVAEDIWRELMNHSSECLPSLLAVGRVGRSLENILRGQMDGPTLLDEVRNAPVAKDARHADAAYQGIRQAVDALVQGLAKDWPARQCLRVLEVAAAPCGLTEVLDTHLSQDRFHHVMALSDTEALSQANLRYGKHTSVRTMSFDTVQWLFEDGHVPQDSFDIIIIHYALHKAVHLSDALVQVRGLLTKGGLLLVAERHPDWSVDFLEGLHPSWWHTGTEATEGKPLSSLLSPDAWQHILKEQGFSQCVTYTEPAAEELAEGAYLLLAKNSLENTASGAEPEAHLWLLLADAASRLLAEELCARLKACGQRADCVYDDAPFDPDVDHVVFLRGADDSPHAVTPTLDALRRCALDCAARDASAPRLWVITRGGCLSTHLPENCTPRPAQCAVWGLGRVIMNEYGELRCTLLDVPGPLHASDLAAMLEKELLYPDGNDEILLTPQGRYVLRLKEGCPKDAMAVGGAKSEEPVAGRYRLDFAVPGMLRNLVWGEDVQHSLAPGAVEARVMATGLNFRDVMLVMGLLPDDAVENGFAGPHLGLEFAGVITRVGEGIQDLKKGDRVVGFAPSCFASHVVTPAHTVAHMPEHWSFAAAATIPTVFFTAWYALKHLAQIRPGERVLIHGAAGGVGLAAIQVARHLGAEIFATAGSEEKRDLIRLLGVEHVFDSRSLSFAHDVLAATDGQGVDAVLNSLAGEAMRRSLSILRPFGRFLELGKRDFVENTSLGLRPFKENISYFAIDADQLLTARPQLAAELFQEVMQLLREEVFTPLPYRTFSATQVVDAFRTMQQSRHMGKIVLTPENAFATPRTPESASSTVSHQDGTWLITGGLSGFGLATARQLAEHGVKNLVLVGRRGAHTPEAERTVADFAAMGVNARAEACDMTDKAAVHAMVARIREALPPLTGVVHAAAVFDDRLLARLDAASFESVLAPKLSGAWYLHEATLDAPLEYFVLYSSVSTALGNPGQGNYVAANAGLEGLAQLRTRMGLPAICIAWGPVGDVGYLARHDAVKKSLAQRLGKAPLSSAQAMAQLATALDEGGVRILAPVDWKAVKSMFLDGAASRFGHVFHHVDQQGGTEAVQDIHQQLAGKSPEEIMEIVRRFTVEEVAQVLALSVEQVSSERTLQAMGMDSLMAVELAVSLEQRIGVRLPAMMLQDSPTVEQIAGRIVARLMGATQDESDEAVATKLARLHAEELSEGDAAAMAQVSRAPQDTGSKGARL